MAQRGRLCAPHKRERPTILGCCLGFQPVRPIQQKRRALWCWNTPTILPKSDRKIFPSSSWLVIISSSDAIISLFLFLFLFFSNTLSRQASYWISFFFFWFPLYLLTKFAVQPHRCRHSQLDVKTYLTLSSVVLSTLDTLITSYFLRMIGRSFKNYTHCL